jgi:hypothetical protein
MAYACVHVYGVGVRLWRMGVCTSMAYVYVYGGYAGSQDPPLPSLMRRLQGPALRP